MADSFQLRVVTPSRAVLDERVREVTAPGTAGEIGVLPEHITFLGSLDIGIFSYRTDQGVKRLAIRGGFAELVGDAMTVLADDAAFPQDVKPEIVKRDLAQADAALEGVSQYDARYPELAANQKWAQTRLDVTRAA